MAAALCRTATPPTSPRPCTSGPLAGLFDDAVFPSATVDGKVVMVPVHRRCHQRAVVQQADPGRRRHHAAHDLGRAAGGLRHAERRGHHPHRDRATRTCGRRATGSATWSPGSSARTSTRPRWAAPASSTPRSGRRRSATSPSWPTTSASTTAPTPIDDNAGAQLFFQGEAAMHPIGSWLVSWAHRRGAGPRLRLRQPGRPCPRALPGNQDSVIGVETGYIVNAKSPNIPAAVEFLALSTAPRTSRRSSTAEVTPLAKSAPRGPADRHPSDAASPTCSTSAPAVVLPPDTGYDLKMADALYRRRGRRARWPDDPRGRARGHRPEARPVAHRVAGRPHAWRPARSIHQTTHDAMKPDRAITPWLFLAPGLVVFGFAVLLPMVLTGGYSFIDWNGFGPMTFVGLDNYARAARDAVFRGSFVHVLIYIAATLVLEVMVGLGLAGLVSMRHRPAVVPGRHLHAGDAADGRRRGALVVRLQPRLRPAQRRPRGARARGAPAHLAGRHVDRAAGDQRRLGLGVRGLLHDDLLRRVPADPVRGHRGGAPRRRGGVGAVPAHQGAHDPERHRGRGAAVRDGRLPGLRPVLRAHQRRPVRRHRDPHHAPGQDGVPRRRGRLRVRDGGPAHGDRGGRRADVRAGSSATLVRGARRRPSP